MRYFIKDLIIFCRATKGKICNLHHKMSLVDLGISAGFIGGISLAALIARTLVGRLVKEGLVKELVFEAIAAAELCACCFELIIGKCIYSLFKGNYVQNACFIRPFSSMQKF